MEGSREELEQEVRFWRGQAQAAKDFIARERADCDEKSRPDPPPLNDRDEMWEKALRDVENERDKAVQQERERIWKRVSFDSRLARWVKESLKIILFDG